MPKVYHARLEVPSGSRTHKLFDWLNRLLESHGMKVTCLRTEDGSDQIATPGTPLLPGDHSATLSHFGKVTEFDHAAIKHMADRFLAWKLPEDFHPDAGISFKPTFNDHMDPPMRHSPVGTNLLSYSQAEAMIRHLVEGLPAHDPVMPELKEAEL